MTITEKLGRLEATVADAGSARTITLRGRIDESTNLSARAAAWATPTVTIDTEGVTFINSIGVREWMRLLRGLADAGSKVTLVKCAEVLIEQINMIDEARAGADVVSFHAPYQCTKCGLEASMLLVVAEHGPALRRMEAPNLPCPDCKQAMELYEVPEKFFTFLVDDVGGAG